MKEQSGTALQRAKETMPLKLVTPDDVFDRMKGAYNSIARRAYGIKPSRSVRPTRPSTWSGAQIKSFA